MVSELERILRLGSGVPTFDERDAKIVDERVADNNKRQGPRVGDYIVFADNVTRRISHVWDWGDDDTCVQTSAGGSYHLGEEGVSFSGTLYRSVRADTLTLQNETRKGDVWIFHHGYQQAHNAVHAQVDFRVYHSTENAPS